MRVLVIDDSAVSREVIRKELENGGYEVHVAAHGGEALARFAKLRPQLVTLDIELGDEDGFAVCRQIRALEEELGQGQQRDLANVPVVFVTGHDSVAFRERGFEVGAADFVTKSIGAIALRERVDAILRPGKVWKGTTALVADDSTLYLHVIASALGRMGVRVLSAHDGLEACSLAQQHRAALDLVILDSEMPGRTGKEVCQFIRQDMGLAEIPITMISAQGDRDAILGMFHAGATDYVTKPFTLEEFLARVHAHLRVGMLTKTLTAWKTEMQQHLRLASAVQQSAMRKVPTVEFADIDLAYLPLQEVSGDVYDLAVNTQGELGILVGDAMGHGIDAALMTMMMHAGLASLGSDLSASQVLERLHALISHRTGDRYVTGACLRMNASGAVTVASAGHPPLVVIRKSAPAVICAEAGGPPLGAFPGMLLDAGQKCLTLQHGDRLLLYTDGLTEQRCSDEQEFGLERVVSSLQRTLGEPNAVAMQHLLSEIKAAAGSQPAGDDLTAVLVHFR